jgi:hypothetical protein
MMHPILAGPVVAVAGVQAPHGFLYITTYNYSLESYDKMTAAQASTTVE